MTKTELLDRWARDSEQRILLARILDRQAMAEQRGIPAHTGFLSPAEQAVSADMLMMAAPGQGVLAGGYDDAERRIWCFPPDWLEPADWLAAEDGPLCAVEVSVPPMAKLTHRDYLGSLMGLGITREKLGDILLAEHGAQVVALREVLPILLTQWGQAGRYPVQLREIPLSSLCPAEGERKAIHATVASVRLDAVLASGFSLSRTRAAELIRGGRVSVNHRPCEKADHTLADGDVLTCRGLGKCVLKSIGGNSRRGRIVLELERYL